MKSGTMNYSTPDAGGWRAKADDLFLAGYRGRPCEICGRTHVHYAGRKTRSCGHHLLEKVLHRAYRYSRENVVVLCADHHSQHDRRISPHSDDTAAVAAFYEWLRVKKLEQWQWFKDHARDEWDKSWKYKEKYIELGGEIIGDLIKDHKPLNHAEKIRIAEER